jgi:hypothetical protein
MHRSRRSILPRVVAASVAIASSLAAGHVSAQDVTIAPKLRTGDQFQLALVRTRENSAQPQQNARSRTVVDVRVLSATPGGFVLEWAPGDTTLDNPGLAQNPLFVAALQAVRDVRFHLTLNADGGLTGLANRTEVLPKLQSVVDTIVQELSARLPIEQRQAMLRVVGQVLSPDLLIASATREAAIYFGLNGLTLSTGARAEVRLEQPSPFGPGTIPAAFRVHLVSTTPDTASLATETTYDRTAVLRMTESLAREAGAPMPPEQLARMPPLDISDTGTYVFDRSVGLMTELIVNRVVVAGSARRLDGWEIRLLEPPRR